MNYISPIFQPIVDAWDWLTIDQEFAKQTELKYDWHSKFLQNERLKVNNQFKKWYHMLYDKPEFLDYFQENVYRFTVLAGLDRLITFRQAHSFLKTRLAFGNNNASALQAMVTSQSALRGWMTGNLWNVLYFTLVPYHSLLWAKNDFTNFMIANLALEAMFYPIDTIKTLLQCDVNKTFKNTWDLIGRTASEGGYKQFYRGLNFKLLYNVLFGANYWSYANDSNLIYLTAPLFILSYPVLTLKTLSQVSGSPLSHYKSNVEENFYALLSKEGASAAYRGCLPFIALNTFLIYQFPILFSEKKKTRILSEIESSKPRETFLGENAWS